MRKSYLFIFSSIAWPLFAEENPAQPTVSYEEAFVKMLATLGVMLLLLVVSIWAFRRFSQGRLRGPTHSKTIKIIERRALSPKSMLYLVEISGGKQILLAESQLEIRKIDEVTPSLNQPH